MRRRLFNVAAAVSAVVLFLLLIVMPMTDSMHRIWQPLALTPTCHLDIHPLGSGTRLDLFNNADFGPYFGSILSLEGDLNPPRVRGFGMVAGIYYRHITWPNGGTWWTLSVSLFYPLVAAAVLPVAWLMRRRRKSRLVTGNETAL